MNLRNDPLYLVDSAFAILRTKACCGLAQVEEVIRPPRTCRYKNQQVHWWVRVSNFKIPIQVLTKPVRMRRALKKIQEGKAIPRVIIHVRDSLDTVVRKLAECIKLGVDIFRRRMRKYKFENEHPEIVAKWMAIPAGYDAPIYGHSDDNDPSHTRKRKRFRRMCPNHRPPVRTGCYC